MVVLGLRGPGVGNQSLLLLQERDQDLGVDTAGCAHVGDDLCCSLARLAGIVAQRVAEAEGRLRMALEAGVARFTGGHLTVEERLHLRCGPGRPVVEDRVADQVARSEGGGDDGIRRGRRSRLDADGVGGGIRRRHPLGRRPRRELRVEFRLVLLRAPGVGVGRCRCREHPRHDGDRRQKSRQRPSRAAHP